MVPATAAATSKTGAIPVLKVSSYVSHKQRTHLDSPLWQFLQQLFHLTAQPIPDPASNSDQKLKPPLFLSPSPAPLPSSTFFFLPLCFLPHYVHLSNQPVFPEYLLHSGCCLIAGDSAVMKTGKAPALSEFPLPFLHTYTYSTFSHKTNFPSELLCPYTSSKISTCFLWPAE